MGEEEWNKYQINRQRDKATRYYLKKQNEIRMGVERPLFFMGRKIKNIKGLRSGMLVAIRPINRGKLVIWECICDCGNKKNIEGRRISSGETRSCGCKGRGIGSNNYVNHGVKDYGEIPSWYYSVLLKSAKKRNLEFSVNIEHLNDLFIKQNKKCAMSGMDIRFHDRFNKSKTTASLDRIDSSKGYIIGNLQWVNKDLNRMKLTFDQKYFYQLCKSVVVFNNL